MRDGLVGVGLTEDGGSAIRSLAACADIAGVDQAESHKAESHKAKSHKAGKPPTLRAAFFVPMARQRPAIPHPAG